jgi:hypothetical protein
VQAEGIGVTSISVDGSIQTVRFAASTPSFLPS